jgi:hypothetical protein
MVIVMPTNEGSPSFDGQEQPALAYSLSRRKILPQDRSAYLFFLGGMANPVINMRVKHPYRRLIRIRE